jgi:hypothetical protein
MGPVRIFGTGIFGAGALALLVPFGAWFSSYHVTIRFIQGLFTVSTSSLRSKKMPITTVILQDKILGPVFKNRKIRHRQTSESLRIKKERDSRQEM